MKRPIVILLALAVMLMASCEKEIDYPKETPAIPPIETMVLDFGELANPTKSGLKGKKNWMYSASTIGVWNIMLRTTFAIPVKALQVAINQEPTIIDNSTWQWKYNVDGLNDQYSARLVSTTQSEHVKWELYISNSGKNAFEEFLWIEGTSNIDGSGGEWNLYHSAAFQEKMVKIDWKKEADDVEEIKYTYIRNLNNKRQKDNFNGSSLTYGMKEGEYNSYLKVNTFHPQKDSFKSSDIEWCRTNCNGRVKADHFFGNNEWYYWDSKGNDIICN